MSSDNDWVHVKSVEQKRAEQKKRKKERERAAMQEAMGDHVPLGYETYDLVLDKKVQDTWSQTDKTKYGKKEEEPIPDVVFKQPNEVKKGKKGGNSNTKKKKVNLHNEEDLVQLLENILQNTPRAYLPVSGLGEHLYTRTKKSWKKFFSQDFGSFKSFLESHPESFVLNDDKVSLVSDTIDETLQVENDNDNKNISQTKTQTKKQKKNEMIRKNNNNNNNNNNEEEEESISCIDITMQLILLILTIYIIIGMMYFSEPGSKSFDFFPKPFYFAHKKFIAWCETEDLCLEYVPIWLRI